LLFFIIPDLKSFLAKTEKECKNVYGNDPQSKIIVLSAKNHDKRHLLFPKSRKKKAKGKNNKGSPFGLPDIGRFFKQAVEFGYLLF